MRNAHSKSRKELQTIDNSKKSENLNSVSRTIAANLDVQRESIDIEARKSGGSLFNALGMMKKENKAKPTKKKPA